MEDYPSYPRFGCLLSGHRQQVEEWKGVAEQGRAVELGQALRMNGSGDCSLWKGALSCSVLANVRHP
jgi:hypothetical protein